MRAYILLAFLAISNIIYCNENAISRKYSDTIPSRFKFSVETLRNHIYNNLPNYYKVGKYERMSFSFADQQALFISRFISSGDVYSDWEELEKYINDVLKKVTPDFLKKDSMIHAYIAKDGRYNAFMTATGHTFVNIGLFAHINDEAELAAVLCHELAHYYLKHSIREHIKAETGGFNSGLFADNKYEEKFSIEMETEADSMAMIWLNESGYSINGLLNSYRTLQRLQTNHLKQLKDKWKLEATTHPLADERLNNFKKFFEENKDNPGESFLVSEEQFSKFQVEAYEEVLYHLLNDFDFEYCTEMAFKFHLFAPDNTIYIYYLLESIRRTAYLDNEIWKENFITNKYYDIKTIYGSQQKVKVSDHLFKKFDMEIMGMSPKEINKVKAKFYWQGDPKFATYNQAYDFFYIVSQHLSCNECILSNALSQTHNIHVRDSLLKIYLSKENIMYREFAKNLKENGITGSLKNKQLLVYNEFRLAVRQGEEIIQFRAKSNNDIKLYSSIHDSIKYYFPEKSHINLIELKEHQLSEYLLFRKMFMYSLIPIVSKGIKAELFILDPTLIELFYKYNVNEVEFLTCIYGDYRKPESSIEKYKEAINTDLSSLLNSTKSTRSMSIYVNSLRAIKNKTSKFFYPSFRHIRASHEIKFKFNETAYSRMFFYIKNQILLKQKEMEEEDRIEASHKK